MKNVLLVALFAFSATVFAQQNAGPNQNEPALLGQRQRPDKGIVSSLNLSNDQQAKLKSISKEYQQKDSIAFAEFRNQQENKRIEQLNAFKSILNKDQLDQFEKIQKNQEFTEVFGGQRPNGMRMERGGFMGMNGQSGRMGFQQPESNGQSQNRSNGMRMEQRGGSMGQNEGEGARTGMQQRNFDGQGQRQDNSKGMRMGQQRGGFIGQNGSNNRMGMQNFAMNGPGRGQSFGRNGKNLTPEERAKQQTKQLTNVLNLTDKQVAKIQNINLKYNQEGSTNQGYRGNKSDFTENANAKQKKIESILNKDQKEKYETLLKESHNNSNDLNNRHGQQRDQRQEGQPM